MEYRELLRAELTVELFRYFDRYQKVQRCWRKEAGNWVLKDIAFTEQWDAADYAYLVKCLQNTLETVGSVTGAFDEAGKLVGFASVEPRRLGSNTVSFPACTFPANAAAGGSAAGSLHAQVRPGTGSARRSFTSLRIPRKKRRRFTMQKAA